MWRGWGVAAVLGLCVAAPGTGCGEQAMRERGLRDYRCDEPGRVYFGRLPLIRRPASVASSDAYGRIPEYVRIRDERISPDTPLYTLLMKAATDHFLAAVAEVARAHDHDIVAERGAIQRADPDVPEVPDRTVEVLAALARR